MLPLFVPSEPALWYKKRRGGKNHDVDIRVLFISVFPLFHLLIQTCICQVFIVTWMLFYSILTEILTQSVKVMFFALTYITT